MSDLRLLLFLFFEKNGRQTNTRTHKSRQTKLKNTSCNSANVLLWAAISAASSSQCSYVERTDYGAHKRTKIKSKDRKRRKRRSVIDLRCHMSAVQWAPDWESVEWSRFAGRGRPCAAGSARQSRARAAAQCACRSVGRWSRHTVHRWQSLREELRLSPWKRTQRGKDGVRVLEQTMGRHAQTHSYRQLQIRWQFKQ